jgi:hypothetical protein
VDLDVDPDGDVGDVYAGPDPVELPAGVHELQVDPIGATVKLNLDEPATVSQNTLEGEDRPALVIERGDAVVYLFAPTHVVGIDEQDEWVEIDVREDLPDLIASDPNVNRFLEIDLAAVEHESPLYPDVFAFTNRATEHFIGSGAVRVQFLVLTGDAPFVAGAGDDGSWSSYAVVENADGVTLVFGSHLEHALFLFELLGIEAGTAAEDVAEGN